MMGVQKDPPPGLAPVEKEEREPDRVEAAGKHAHRQRCCRQTQADPIPTSDQTLFDFYLMDSNQTKRKPGPNPTRKLLATAAAYPQHAMHTIAEEGSVQHQPPQA